MSLNTVRKPAGIKYRLIKERIPQGTSLVHYITPIEVNGRLTQEIPVSELEANPGKYASMFPQYFERVLPTTGSGNPMNIRSLNKDYKVENGRVIKKIPRRTVSDIATQTTHTDTKSQSTSTVVTQTVLPTTDTEGKKTRK